MLQIYEVPFFVALDHKREAVVVAVRGTLSLKVPSECYLLFSFGKFLNICLHTFGMLCNILILFIFKITTYCEKFNFSTFDFFLFAIFKVNFYFSLIIMLCLNSIFQPLEFFPPRLSYFCMHKNGQIGLKMQTEICVWSSSEAGLNLVAAGLFSRTSWRTCLLNVRTCQLKEFLEPATLTRSMKNTLYLGAIHYSHTGLNH